MSSQPYVNITRYFDQVSNKTVNSPTQMHTGHQVILPDDLPSPSIPIHPGSPILMGSHSEGSPMAENHASLSTDEELVAEQRTSFAQHTARAAG